MKFRACLVFLVCVIPAIALADDSQCGDDGPGGFTDISGAVLGKIKPVDTVGGVQELAFLEDSNTLVYRNQRNELYANAFEKEGSDLLWPRLNFPLARPIDPQHRYLPVEGSGEVFDVPAREWRKYDDGPGGFALFWDRERLVSIRPMDDYGRQAFRVYRYSPADGDLETCVIRPPGGEHYRIAKGNTYPYIHLYYEEHLPRSRKIHFLRYTLRCQRRILVWPLVLRSPLNARLDELFQYGFRGPTALKFDHPTKSLILHRGWVYEDAPTPPPAVCHVYNIENQQPFFLHPRSPIIATWTRSRGVKLFFLNEKEGQVANITQGMTISDIDPSRLWLTRDADRLFIAPGFSGEAERKAFEISLAPPVRP